MSVLATRYASKEMLEIWSPENKIKAERKLWIEVMRFQAKALKIPTDSIAKYEAALEKIDLASIDEREKKSRHDVKARIDEFNALAGYEYIHLGMTSRDLTENIELFQMKESLSIVLRKSHVLLKTLNKSINKYASLLILGRTHNVPAQLTTLGRRFANWAEELLFAIENLENLIERLPLRGIRGAVGTSADLRQIISTDLSQIDKEVEKLLGFQNSLIAPTQVYPRSIDFEVISGLCQLSMPPSNLAINIRLMSGFGLVSEDFTDGQTGSSAMPHKVNPRLSERVNALCVILKGFLTMTSEISGEQWNEGDVSCSAVRRVALQDSFLTIDAILDTSIAILNGLKVFENEIQREIEAHLPELLSTSVLMLCVKNGMQREQAHHKIKRHSLGGLEDKRTTNRNTFLERIENDETLKIQRVEIDKMIGNLRSLSGDAEKQALLVNKKIENKVLGYKDGLEYAEREIL